MLMTLENHKYYTGIMLDAFAILLCSKLCWHNWLKPTIHSTIHELTILRAQVMIIRNTYTIAYGNITRGRPWPLMAMQNQSLIYMHMHTDFQGYP